jgi:hypothetical protein
MWNAIQQGVKYLINLLIHWYTVFMRGGVWSEWTIGHLFNRENKHFEELYSQFTKKNIFFLETYKPVWTQTVHKWSLDNKWILCNYAG